MAPPTEAYTNIPTANVQADKPWIELIADGMRGNIERIFEILLAPGVAPDDAQIEIGHSHKGPLVDGSTLISISNNIKFKDELPGMTVPPSTSFTDLDVTEHVVPDLTNLDMQFFDGTTNSDITSSLQHNDVISGTIFDDATNDRLYIGLNEQFIRLLLGSIANPRTGQGALIAKYFNGTSFVALSGVVDTTLVSGDTLAQQGEVNFTLPTDWAVGADAVSGLSFLDSSLFYAELAVTSDPSAFMQADQLVPKIDVAKFVFIKFFVNETSDQKAGLRWRRNGAPQTQVRHASEGDSEGTQLIPVDANEVLEHSLVGTPSSISTYELAGFIT